MYTVFYKPYKARCLPTHLCYLSALVQDNPFIEKDYISALLSTSDKVKKERLFKGNWEYDDNPNALCQHDTILEIFGNTLAKRTGEKYLTADIARYGSDVARIAVWDGWDIIEYRCFATSATTEIQVAIEHLRKKHNIPRWRCIADEDGVGGGVVDNCRIRGFVNNSSPFDDENYLNLQTQCGYKLADHINAGDVGFSAEISVGDMDTIVVELEQLQTWDVDSDKKLRLKPKEQIKTDIGHSPDWRDTFLMRAYFDYKATRPIDTKRLERLIY